MIRNKKNLCVVALVSVLLSACGSTPKLGSDEDKNTAHDNKVTAQPVTLADLPPVPLPANEKLPKVAIEKLVASYINIIDEVDNPELRLAISRRLADLGMMLGENQQIVDEHKADNAIEPSQFVSGDKLRGYFESAIESYRSILANHPENENNDKLIYQLAKAYDLESMQDESLELLNRLVRDFPASDYIVEVQFRRAEIFFSRGNYQAADDAYSYVVKRGEYTDFYQNALYMLGWTRFKRGRYEESLKQFVIILDQLMIDKDRNELNRSKQEMLDDTLRIMGLAYFYLDGAKSIAALYNDFGAREYEHLHYEKLSELYLEKERYRDSYETVMAFVALYPMNVNAPRYHIKAIDALRMGDFPTLVRPAQEDYAKKYGMASKFWYLVDEPTKAEIKKNLKEFLPQFARYYHSLGQSMHKKGESLNRYPDELKIKQNYLTAGFWYGEYLKTFPIDKRAAEMHFLQAEALFEAEDYTGAVAAYETTAYQYPEYEKASEAAYSALLAYERYEKIVDNEHSKDWHRAKIIGQLKFATTFGKDRRSHAVQLKAAQELYALEDFQAAITAATHVTEWQPPVDETSRLAAWRVIALANFEMKQFANAETAYKEVLKLLPRDNAESKELQEKYAASIYKQGEAYVQAGDLSRAVAQFLRVVSDAPDSSVRIAAQYDAATHLLTLEKWQLAIDELIRFRNSFPSHELTKTVPAKLVLAYQKLDQWNNEAGELRNLASNESDPNAKQQTLFMAGESYERAGNLAKAIDSYRDYANSYPDPLEQAMEANYKLSELYGKINDPNKRYYWLQKIVDMQNSAGNKQTPRTLSLAASSSFELALQHENAFVRTKLTLPLDASLQTKKKLLKRAIKAFTTTAGYGVQEYTTAATFKIAQIYSQLSKDLLASQRPKNLDAMELEQYEVLLEEQAFPFEETAIHIHEENVHRGWNGVYDQWVKQSFEALRVLLPARYAKDELMKQVNDEIY